MPGTLDSTFGTDGIVRSDFGVDSQARAIAMQPDGCIVVAGTFEGGSLGVARYLPDGTRDFSFGIYAGLIGVPDAIPEAIVVEPDSRIVIVGKIETDTSPLGRFFAVRLSKDGTLDATFGNNGIAIAGLTDENGVPLESHAYGVALQKDGKILVAGEARDVYGRPRMALTRFTTSGALDATFDDDGKILVGTNAWLDGLKQDYYSGATSVAVDALGRIVVAGYVSRDVPTGPNSYETASRIGLRRYVSTGAPDLGFGNFGEVHETIFTVNPAYDRADGLALLSDGSIFIAGTADAGGGNNFLTARYGVDGSQQFWHHFDLAGYTDDRALDMALQSDGKILIAGKTVSASGGDDVALVRVTASGVLDKSFADNGVAILDIDAGDAARSVALQTNGKIVVAGYAGQRAATSQGDFLDGSAGDFALARYHGGSLSVTLAPLMLPGLSREISVVVAAAAVEAIIAAFQFLPTGGSDLVHGVGRPTVRAFETIHRQAYLESIPYKALGEDYAKTRRDISENRQSEEEAIRPDLLSDHFIGDERREPAEFYP
jgi:uncharacterized delta-60 repeat protein